MNKNLKLISTLAAAGIITASGFANIANAATPKSFGKYATLNKLTNVVPYILNTDEKVTYADLKNEFGSDITPVVPAADDALVGTGTQFKSNGKTYTVLVYGDVNGDGLINPDDASVLVDSEVNDTPLTDLQKEAANVENVSAHVVNLNDATQILKYDVTDISKVRAEDPEGEKEQEDTSTGYTLTVGTNNIINNQNKDNTQITIDVAAKKISNDDKTIKFRVKDHDEITITDQTLNKNTNKNEAFINAFSSIDNGTYTVEAYEVVNGKETVLATANVNRAVYEPKAANIVATRTDAKSAVLSLDGIGNSKLAKVKYTVAGSTEKELTVNNNKLTNAKLDNVFGENSTTATLKLVDEYGNEADVEDPVVIPQYGATAVAKATKITEPDLSKSSAVEFTVEGATTDNEVNVYKDGTLIANTINDDDGNEIKLTVNSGKVNITKIVEEKGSGKYSIGVINKGDANGTTTDSEEVKSKEVEVKTLNKIANVKFAVKDDAAKTNTITFEDSNDVKNLKTDDTDKLVDNYEFAFYKYDTEKKEFSKTADSTVSVTKVTGKDGKYEAVLSGIKANTTYKATVKTIARDNQAEFVSAEATESKPFFYIDATQLLDEKTGETDTTLTYSVKTPIDLDNVTYKAVVSKVRTDENKNNYVDGTKETKNATLKEDKDGNKSLTIEGLDQNTQYVFKIVATSGDITGESGLTGYDATNKYSEAPRTLSTSLALSGLKVVKSSDESKAVKGTLFINGDTVIVDGDTTNKIDTKSNNYSDTFNNNLEFAKSLRDDDVITINDKVVTLKLTETASDVDAINLSNKETGITLNISGNGKAVDRKLTVASGAKLNALNVEGNGLILALENNDTANTKVTLKDGAEVTGNAKYTVVKGATVTINGVKVVSDNADIDVDATGKALTVSTKKGLKTNLTFTNLIDGRYTNGAATINFTGDDTNSSELVGKVTISSEGGSVAVSADKTDVSELNLDVTAKDATVDVTKFNNAKDVNITATTSKDATPITVKSEISDEKIKLLGDNVTSANINLKDGKYYDADSKEITDEATVAKYNAFVNALGTGIKNATISLSGKTVTVTVPAETTLNLTGLTK